MNSKIGAATLLTLALFAAAPASYALNSVEFKNVAVGAIKEIVAGAKDVDSIIAKQEQLLKLGVEGSLSYADGNPDAAAPLRLVAKHADEMPQLSLEQIEELWGHDQEMFKENGIDLSVYDDFSPVTMLLHTVIHSAENIILLKQYKSSKDEELLAEVKDMLTELMDEIGYIQ